MTSQTTLLPSAPLVSTAAVVSFIPICDKDKALAFYRDKLGLELVADESPYALVFNVAEAMLRATFVGDFKPQPFTILGWQVTDIESAVQQLQAAQIEFTRYPWMQSDGLLPIWKAPDGAQIAWFNDPFGNVLSLTQFG
jgi:catechol 2,3-dioxygenase-like lactoylglutathione lyase family enzyme